ncbi:MAG: hypothetical protein KAG34_02075 [Cocleimonas sp.]|nr:hypothetical protein [Cocleimonas sp.]
MKKSNIILKLLLSLSFILLLGNIQAAPIIIDGDLSDWSENDRLEVPPREPVAGFELYGRYENNSYKIALHSLNGTIDTSTTFWLNTDQDSTTGYLVWGFAGGAEYNINIAADGKPYLYTGADGETLVSGPLLYSNIPDGASGSVIEIELPESLIGSPSSEGINMLADVNNTNFLPSSYWPHNNNYILLKNPSANSGNIQIDGNKSDWNNEDRLDLGAHHSVNDAELYGRYEEGKYKILLHHFTEIIGQNTTIWLNTDQNTSTGHQIWGFAAGAEYNINIHSDGKPYLYTDDASQTYVTGPLTYVKVSDGNGGSILELEVPEGLINTPTAEGINLLLDVNNSIFMPRSYSPNSNNYILPRFPNRAPIGIVYSKTTEAHFFNKKAYAQLFMSVQAQAMMAGLPFDLLNEDDLLDITKIKNYKTLVFPSFSNVKTSQLTAIEQTLNTAVNQHNIGIITAGNFLTNDETGAALAGDSYSRMKSFMGVTRTTGAGPIDSEYTISNIDHPVTNGEYTLGEVIKNYDGIWTDYFSPTGSYNTATVATQVVAGETHNALITIDHGGRHAHFATVAHMTDVNLLWSTMQWSVFGDKAPASLQMSRHKAIFVSRNDMDQSMFSDEVANVNGQLLTILQTWKNNYDFVGSYYINVGNNPANQEETNWSYSGPLYQSYMALGNEMGTHSYTHPHDTNLLSDAQIRFEFEDSVSVIEQNLGLTNLGAAVPGMPELLHASTEIIKYVDYLSGGYSAVGAGYTNAMGFLDPSYSKVYLSPNMSFDFTLVGFQNLTAAQAKQVWFNEFDALVAHNNQALIHWPWHDYGPNDTDNSGYTFDMFDALISKAHQFGSEFITGKDFADRIKTFGNSGISISKQGDTIIGKVSANNSGQFALKVAKGSSIKSVDNWYAYDDKNVFLDSDGGNYTIRLGSSPDAVTHISALPSRSKLIAASGDGTDLQFTFKGKGKVKVALKCNPSSINVSGGSSSYTTAGASAININFTNNIQHAETVVDISCN